MQKHFFPRNFIKLQKPPVITVKKRSDGAIIVDPKSQESRIGSTTYTGTDTNTNTHTDTYTGTDTSTNTVTHNYTGTANAAHLTGSDVSMQVACTLQKVDFAGVQHNKTEAFTTPDQEALCDCVDEENTPVSDVKEINITSTEINPPVLPQFETLSFEAAPSELQKTSTVLLGDYDDNPDSDKDSDGDYDSDSDSDKETDGDTDYDERTTEGVSINFEKLYVKPPLANSDIKVQRNKS